MADEIQTPAQMPPVLPANKIAMVGSASDIIIHFGVSRAAFGPDGTMLGQQVEYSPGHMMSMAVAKQLHDMLSQGLAAYEKQFGTIAVEQGSVKVAAAGNPTK